jgi:CheY-like chemotaxis protein
MPNPPLILIVDDDVNFLEIFGTKLTAAGFRVETAKDGSEAFQKAKQERPDLILMDVQMPRVNGVEALLKLKEDPDCKDMKVMFLTALGDPRFDAQEIHRRLAREIGAVGFLKKTEDLDVIADRIRTLLQ